MALADAAPFAAWHANLDEASGNRATTVGGFTFTDNNTVASAAGMFGNAADFESSNAESLTAADSAAASVGDTLFMIRAWVKFESLTVCSIVYKGGSNDLAYDLGCDVLRFRFRACSGSGFANLTTVTANTFGTIPTGTWCLVHAWHDPIANTLNIRVNNGVVDSVSYSAGSYDDGGSLYLGNNPFAEPFDGLLDDPVLLKGYALDDTEVAEDWASGAGVAFEDWAGAGPPVVPDWYESRANGDANDFNTWKRNGVNATSGQIPATGTTVRVSHAVTFAANQTIGLDSGLTAPQADADLPSLSQSAGGGGLTAGTYHLVYTNVAASGESGPSGEVSLTLSNTGDTLTVTLPALPGGIDSRSVYLSPAFGGSYTERLYATGITGTTFDLTSASWTDGTTTYANARPIPVAILIDGTGTVSVPTGVTLTMQGDLVDAGAGVTVAGTGRIEFTPSSGAVYSWLVGVFSTNTAKITTTGAGWFIGANAGGGTLWIGTGNIAGVGLAANPDGFDFGGTGTLARLDNGTTGILYNQFGGAGRKVKFHGVTFDACNEIKGNTGTDTDAQIEFVDCHFINSVGTRNLNIGVDGVTPTGSGSRLIDNCTFDKTIRINLDGFTFTDNKVLGGWELTGGRWALCERNLIQHITPDLVWSWAASHANNWFLAMAVDGSNITNQHWSGNTFTTDATINATDNLFEGWAVDGGGDVLLVGGAGNVYTLERNIGIRSAVEHTGISHRGGPGTLITTSGTNTDNGLRYIVRHNTWFVDGQAMVAVGELGTGDPSYFVGMVEAIQSNYVWGDGNYDDDGPGPVGAYIIDKHPAATAIDDVVLAANCTNNMRYLLGTGSAGKGYNFGFSSGSPGTGDVLGDIGFVEERNILTYANSLGKTGTDFAKAQAVVDDMANNVLTVQDYLDYARAGYAPTNVAAHNAAHDGTDIGAVQGDFPSTGSPATYYAQMMAG